MTADFKVELLVTVVIVSLTVLVITGVLSLSASPVSASPDGYEIIVLGKDTAYSINNRAPPPLEMYERGDLPPLMMAKRVGSGAVVAAGFAPACRNGQWNNPENPDPHLPELLDASFQWMVPMAWMVAWYEQFPDNIRPSDYSDLISALENYQIDYVSGPITDNLLAPYDILVLPQLQLPYPPSAEYPSGNPNLLPDDYIQAIKRFVEGGKGLLIMEATDFFAYKYPEVQNKILFELGFDYLFQDDSVYDDTNNIAGANYRAIVDIDPTTEIGAAYENLTGKTSIGLYGYCSLTVVSWRPSFSVFPDYQVGIPGTTLEYDVIVFNPINPAAEDLTYILSVEDNEGWDLMLEDNSLFVPIGGNMKTVLSVTIPADEKLCTEDVITLTVKVSGYPRVQGSSTCIAHAGLRIEPTDDTYVSTHENDTNYNNENSLRVGRYYEYLQWPYLKFDLSEIPPGTNITDAKLCLYCYSAYARGFDVLCHEVEDDIWMEDTITWNTKPTLGDTLDTQFVSAASYDSPEPYFWDVTSFVQQEFWGDEWVSFCLRPLDNLPTSTTRAFWSKERYESRTQPFLRITYEVLPPIKFISISPGEANAGRGQTITFTVTVSNMGTFTETYDLEVTESYGWGATLDNNLLEDVESGTSRNVTLSVIIPSDAEDGDEDTITVTATSRVFTEVSDSASSIARCVVSVERGVQVSIDPSEQSGGQGKALTYTVTVTNTGDATDNYELTIIDTAVPSWNPTVSPTSLTIAAKESETATLSVVVPPDATEGTSMTINVSVRSEGDPAVVGTDTCRMIVGGAPVGPEVPLAISAFLIGTVILVIVYLLRVRPKKAARRWVFRV